MSNRDLGVSADTALPGREIPVPVPPVHAVLGTAMVGPFPKYERALFAMGCFWGVERMFWQLDGVHTTAVGYTDGFTKNPHYKEVCSGATGHTEAVLVVFDPSVISYEKLLQGFWQGHDPTQGMRQGNDQGTQYRSGIYTFNEDQAAIAAQSKEGYQEELRAAGFTEITTELRPASEFFYAEDYHQQYLHKNPGGYCGIGGTGVSCPIGLSTSDL